MTEKADLPSGDAGKVTEEQVEAGTAPRGSGVSGDEPGPGAETGAEGEAGQGPDDEDTTRR